jgi:hypothetical protein
MPLAFISHNRADKALAEEIGMRLVAEGCGVWFDKWEIAPGDSIFGRINDGLGKTTHLLVLWSKDAAVSRWVGSELAAAISRMLGDGSMRVVPVRLDDTPLPPLLADIAYIDYRKPSEAGLREVVGAVLGHPPSQNFLRAFVAKYHDLIIDQSPTGDPLPYKACPRCGSLSLRRSGGDDPKGEPWFLIECGDCDWEEYG